jgi:uncharacterized lipoprotein YddW (UPF0748 family)
MVFIVWNTSVRSNVTQSVKDVIQYVQNIKKTKRITVSCTYIGRMLRKYVQYVTEYVKYFAR